MFCSKCGKEIHDEAVVCVHCGCAVGGNTIPKARQHSEDYSKFKAFQENVNTIHILGIVSLVLCLGIGIIFQIINIIKINKYADKSVRSRYCYWLYAKYDLPEFNLKDGHEIEEYENTVRKFNNAKIMTTIGWVVSGILLAIILMALAMTL